MVYVAVDIGKRRCVTCVMDQDGSILDTSSYPNTSLDASHYARLMVEADGPALSAGFRMQVPLTRVTPRFLKALGYTRPQVFSS
jgi:hypothetical protein